VKFKQKTIVSKSYQLIEFMEYKTDWYKKIYHLNENFDEIIDGYAIYPNVPEIGQKIYFYYNDMIDFPTNEKERTEFENLINEMNRN